MTLHRAREAKGEGKACSHQGMTNPRVHLSSKQNMSHLFTHSKAANTAHAVDDDKAGVASPALTGSCNLVERNNHTATHPRTARRGNSFGDSIESSPSSIRSFAKDFDSASTQLKLVAPTSTPTASFFSHDPLLYHTYPSRQLPQHDNVDGNRSTIRSKGSSSSSSSSGHSRSSSSTKTRLTMRRWDDAETNDSARSDRTGHTARDDQGRAYEMGDKSTEGSTSRTHMSGHSLGTLPQLAHGSRESAALIFVVSSCAVDKSHEQQSIPPPLFSTPPCTKSGYAQHRAASLESDQKHRVSSRGGSALHETYTRRNAEHSTDDHECSSQSPGYSPPLLSWSASSWTRATSAKKVECHLERHAMPDSCNHPNEDSAASSLLLPKATSLPKVRMSDEEENDVSEERTLVRHTRRRSNDECVTPIRASSHSHLDARQDYPRGMQEEQGQCIDAGTRERERLQREACTLSPPVSHSSSQLRVIDDDDPSSFSPMRSRELLHRRSAFGLVAAAPNRCGDKEGHSRHTSRDLSFVRKTIPDSSTTCSSAGNFLSLCGTRALTARSCGPSDLAVTMTASYYHGVFASPEKRAGRVAHSDRGPHASSTCATAPSSEHNSQALSVATTRQEHDTLTSRSPDVALPVHSSSARKSSSMMISKATSNGNHTRKQKQQVHHEQRVHHPRQHEKPPPKAHSRTLSKKAKENNNIVRTQSIRTPRKPNQSDLSRSGVVAAGKTCGVTSTPMRSVVRAEASQDVSKTRMRRELYAWNRLLHQKCEQGLVAEDAV